MALSPEKDMLRLGGQHLAESVMPDALLHLRTQVSGNRRSRGRGANSSAFNTFESINGGKNCKEFHTPHSGNFLETGESFRERAPASGGPLLPGLGLEVSP